MRLHMLVLLITALLWSGASFSNTLSKFAYPTGNSAQHTYEALQRTTDAKRAAVYNSLPVAPGTFDRTFMEGNVRTIPCPNPCPYRTAGFDTTTGHVRFHRWVQPGELLVQVRHESAWQAVLLQNCANPLRHVQPPVQDPPCPPQVWYTPSWYGTPTSHHRCLTIEY